MIFDTLPPRACFWSPCPLYLPRNPSPSQPPPPKTLPSPLWRTQGENPTEKLGHAAEHTTYFFMTKIKLTTMQNIANLCRLQI